jgi:protein TonB
MPSVATANDRFHRSFSSAFWLSLTGATLVHAGIFLLGPRFPLDPPEVAVGPTRVVPGLRPEVPDPPPPLQRPLEPVFAEPGVDAPDLPFPPTVPGAGEFRLAPPAPEGRGGDSAFTPYEIRPRLTNPGAARAALERHYPAGLRGAGIGGTVGVRFHIDETGRVLATRLDRSSGYDSLDRAALEVARVMEFTPAYNRDAPVPVWVSLDITFEVQ